MTRRGSQQSTTTVATIPTSDSKWRGRLVYPSPSEHIKTSMAALSLSTDSNASEAGEEREKDKVDRAVQVAVNGRLGIVAIGTER